MNNAVLILLVVAAITIFVFFIVLDGQTTALSFLHPNHANHDNSGFLTGVVYQPDPSCDKIEMPCGIPYPTKIAVSTIDRSSVVAVTTTDEHGHYVISLSPGEYTFVTSQYTQNFIIEKGMTTTINLRVES